MIRLDGVALGAAPPDDVNILVTASIGSEPLAVRVDDVSGALTVSQLFHTAMRYPGNIGLIPHTLSESADPLQAMVVTGHVIAPGTVIALRPIGVLYVTGEGGEEITVLGVPAARLTSRYDSVANYTDLPAGHLRQIAHFFCHYRDVEEHSRPRKSGWGDVSEARRTIQEAAERARSPVRITD
ncbi:inorganic diphosphatase [Acuticoccus sp. M5D2P5]|uniref:inorganic diphosphatase n=1 Tax=Acuticoccus kalidii TaxID=2910977 RepID=UPI001EFFB1A5|nr:inorganic diphosphatase [Acuticoccus kalidii]MCF3936177.1 inorganic diphosphatase [Acuticoccus kalidii]